MKNKTKKTNYDYVKEFLKGNDEALEFLEALQTDNDFKLKKLQDRNVELAGEVAELEIAEDMASLETIDFGIGILEYKEPDNIKLQSFMEELKDKYETQANFSQLKLAV